MWAKIAGVLIFIWGKIRPSQEKIRSDYNDLLSSSELIISNCEKVLLECKKVISNCNTVLNGSKNNLSRLPGFLFVLRKEFFASLFVASATFLITERGFFEFPEYLTLSMISVGEGRSEPRANNGPIPLKVVLITDLSYESDFNQSSPLDRKKLKEMFEGILERKPRVLAVDLDLSPSGNLTNDQTDLDNLLKNYQKKEGANIVLISPMPVVSPSLLSEKVAWMKEMCDAQITFAYPDVYSHLDVVMKYMEFTPTLGNEAFRLSKLDKTDGDEEGKAKNNYVHSSVCDRLLKRNDDNFLRKNGENRYENLTQKELLNLKVINSKSYSDMRIIHVLDLNRIDWERNISNDDIIFVGGSWGLRDKYITPAIRDIPGAFIHAATFYSNLNPVSDIKPLQGFIVDFIIGMALGIIFLKTYNWYCNKLTIISMLTNFGLPILIMVAMLWLAQISLQFNLWIHPGPMLAGVYVDSQIVGGNSQKVKYGDLVKFICIIVIIWSLVELAIKIQ
ncbi:hypothetical protein MNBD_NITROSPINAE02-81 [hydrothermal vent metagenome]|uniref:CHASE2 domain-containing protein n=1 Tax=hydrothermal vent metagenome TaxID=652676 RepID=A0A3B1BX76_9ZZZZ